MNLTHQPTNLERRTHALASLQCAASEAVRHTLYALTGTKFLSRACEAERATLIATTIEISLLLDNFSSHFFVVGEEAAGKDATSWLLELYRLLEQHRDILGRPGDGQCMYAQHRAALLARFESNVSVHDAPAVAPVAA